MTVIITNLTGLNIAALQQALDEGHIDPKALKLAKTVAYFTGGPDDAHRVANGAKDRFKMLGKSSRSHPVSSLNAVIRKTGDEARFAAEDRVLRSGGTEAEAYEAGRAARGI